MIAMQSSLPPSSLHFSKLLWTEFSVSSILLLLGTFDQPAGVYPGTAALSVSLRSGEKRERERKKRADAPRNNACGAVAAPSIYTLPLYTENVCQHNVALTAQRCQRCV